MSDDKAYEKARIEHAEHSSVVKISAKMTVELGILAMRAPAILAASALAVSLAFYSANSEAHQIAIENLQVLLRWLMLAVLSPVLATGAAYLSQSCYLKSLEHCELIWDHPYSQPTNKSKRWEKLGDALKIVTILLVIGSYFCLLRAGVLFLNWF